MQSPSSVVASAARAAAVMQPVSGLGDGLCLPGQIWQSRYCLFATGPSTGTGTETLGPAEQSAVASSRLFYDLCLTEHLLSPVGSSPSDAASSSVLRSVNKYWGACPLNHLCAPVDLTSAPADFALGHGHGLSRSTSPDEPSSESGDVGVKDGSKRASLRTEPGTGIRCVATNLPSPRSLHRALHLGDHFAHIDSLPTGLRSQGPETDAQLAGLGLRVRVVAADGIAAPRSDVAAVAPPAAAAPVGATQLAVKMVLLPIDQDLHGELGLNSDGELVRAIWLHR